MSLNIKNLLLLVIIGSVFSCAKDNTSDINNNIPEKTYTTKVVKESQILEDNFDFSEDLLDGLFDFYNGEQKSGSRYLDCANVTFANDFWKTPNTITIDFGTGCETPAGDVLSGQIVCSYNKFLNRTGAVRTVTYINFSINGDQVEGVETTSNLGRNDDNYYVVQKELSGGAVTYTDDTNAYLTYFKTFTFAMSGPFSDLNNKNILIEGTSNGTTRDGDTFSTEITSPINLSAECHCTNSGTKTVLVNDDLFTINYGDNTCEAVAQITLPDGTTEEQNFCQ